MILLSVNRQGNFSVGALNHEDKFQCGVSGYTRAYKFIVRISASDKRLIEPSGFVIDNHDINKYFQDTYSNKPFDCISCEEIASKAIVHFHWVCLKNKVDVREIEVTIHPWEYGNKLPEAFIRGLWKRVR